MYFFTGSVGVETGFGIEKGLLDDDGEFGSTVFVSDDSEFIVSIDTLICSHPTTKPTSPSKAIRTAGYTDDFTFIVGGDNNFYLGLAN